MKLLSIYIESQNGWLKFIKFAKHNLERDMKTRFRTHLDVILEDRYERLKLYRSSKYKGLKYAGIACLASGIALMLFMVYYDRQLSDFMWYLLNGCVILLGFSFLATLITYYYLINIHVFKRHAQRWRERWVGNVNDFYDLPSESSGEDSAE